MRPSRSQCKTEKAVCVVLCWRVLWGKTEKKVKVNVQHKWTNEWNNNHNNNTSHNTKPKKVFRDRDWLFYIPLSSWISEKRTNIVYHVFSQANSLPSSFRWKYRFQITWRTIKLHLLFLQWTFVRIKRKAYKCGELRNCVAPRSILR